jgi:ankyrin repeat protein
MMSDKKKIFFITFILLSIGNILSMEPVEKKPKKSKTRRVQTFMSTLGHNIVGVFSGQNPQQRNLAIQELQQSPSFFNDLPEDTRNHIVALLIQGATAETLEVAARTINALAQVNHQFNELFNNHDYCLKIIKNLSQRFNLPNFTVCSALQTQQARIQLKLQTDFLKMCQHARPQEITFTTLCSKGLDIEFTYTYNKQEVTPLMLAALLDNRRMFTYLLDAGVNINHANSYGTTPLMIAITIDHTEDPSWNKNNAGLPLALEQLVTNPALSINQKNSKGDTALMIGIRLGAAIFKLELLLGAGADPEAMNNNGETPLSLAKAIGNQEVIDLIQDAIKKKHRDT